MNNITEISSASKGTYVRPAKLNVYAIDVSGSMGWAIDQLRDDTIRRLQELPQGDAVLIGLFSSEGWFRWVVARELTSTDDYTKVEAIIKESFYTRALTCFSEIVADVPQAIKPFLGKYSVITFTFMSDGCPVVRDTQQERAALLEAAVLLRSYVTAGAIVAYGNYANRPLLSELASTLGVELVSTDSVEQIGLAFSRNVGSKASRKKRVRVPKGSKIVFSLAHDGSVAAFVGTDEELSVAEEVAVYAVTNEAGSGADESLAYATALAYTNTGKIDEALQILSDTGDVAFVEALGSALTNAELAKITTDLKAAILDPKFRFKKGKKVGCLPSEDAFDLIELLDLLQDDGECKFFPKNEAFTYRRIGRRTKTKPGYPTFHSADSVSVPLSRITGHSSELNLSIGVTIPGKISLPVTVTVDGRVLERNKLGLLEWFDTFIYRNYAIIADAMPVATCLPVSISKATHDRLVMEGTLDQDSQYKQGRIYPLDLTRLPVCNRQRGNTATNWERFGLTAVESLELGSIIKVLKAKRNELDPEREAERPIAYTDEQFEFLEACGVKRDGAFSPPTEREDPTDVLDVRTLEVKVAKSSPVTLTDFYKMVSGEKKPNWVGELMMAGHRELAQLPSTKGEAIEWLNKRLHYYQTNKSHIDREINTNRMALALSGAWARNHKTDSVVYQSQKGSQPFEYSISFRTIRKEI